VDRIDEEKMMFRIRTLLASTGASLLALAAATGVAAAADVSPTYEPPPAATYTPTPAWSWTGPYAGLIGGYGWADGSDNLSDSGWIGGGFLGYNLQTNQNLVVGLEGDIAATSKSGNGWDGTFRGRLGYAWDRFMVYGTGGLAVGGLKDTTTSQSSTKVGWTAGAGIEAAITDKITGRLEYRHTNLGEFPSGGSTYTSNDILVGVGFKF
jgi:outer membrane immunogenic protein